MREPRHGLSEDAIVEAAKGLLAERGVDGLTMRALSDRLGVALGATYRHVPNKHALLQLVARSLYADVSHVDGESDGLARVKAVMLEVRRLFASYQGMAAYVSTHLSDFESSAVTTMLIDPLLERGLSPNESEVLVLALVLFTAGALLVKVDPGLEAQAAAAYASGIDLLLAGAVALSSQQR
ncbi:MAG TPA: helix-turn-helix domain-containing protein [Acidimicrobiales bacterium]|jgi:AcrR family transcriptional regulator